MDTKSKILLIVIFCSVFLSLGVTFYKTIILQDFEVVNTQPQENKNKVYE